MHAEPKDRCDTQPTRGRGQRRLPGLPVVWQALRPAFTGPAGYFLLCKKPQHPFRQTFCSVSQVRVGFCHLSPEGAAGKSLYFTQHWLLGKLPAPQSQLHLLAATWPGALRSLTAPQFPFHHSGHFKATSLRFCEVLGGSSVGTGFSS